ncbi:hypothetical protein [Micromonospora sp. NPDC004704]
MVAYAGAGPIAAIAAQTISPTYPVGIGTGDGLILTRTAKPETAAFVAPAGWTLLDEQIGGVGALANDTGLLRIARYWREAAGTETGTQLCDSTPATVDVQQAIITRYTKSASATWSVAAAGGADNATGVDWSVTADENPGITAGDLVEVALCWPTDAARTWSNEVLAAAGATIGTLNVPMASTTTTLGADMATRVHNYACSAGASGAAPVYSATVNSGTNIAGPTSMVRLREVLTEIVGTLAIVLPPLGVAAAGSAEAVGQLAVVLPPLAAELAGAVEVTGTLDVVLPALTAALVGMADTGPIVPGQLTAGGTGPTLTVGGTAPILAAGGRP